MSLLVAITAGTGEAVLLVVSRSIRTAGITIAPTLVPSPTIAAMASSISPSPDAVSFAGWSTRSW